LTNNIIEHILLIWNRCIPYEEKSNAKYTSLTPLVATCILSELFSNNTTPATEQIFNNNFEKLYSSLLVRVASTCGNLMPFPKTKDGETTKQTDSSSTSSKKSSKDKNSTKDSVQNEYKKLQPVKISIECFKQFVKCTQTYELFEFYEDQTVWDLLSDETKNIEGFTLLAKGLCLHAPKHVPIVIKELANFLSAPYDCQKICVTAFLAELTNHKCNLSLIETLMNNLLSKLIDPCTQVRTLCIRGLGNIASLGKELVQKNSTTVLSAMMAGLDDKDDLNDDITFESMNGLTKVIALIDENDVRPILINILLRIRPCFEKDKASVRACSYILFGELARFGSGPSKDPYMEQIHSNFVSFILHLNEDDDEVKKACKFTLRQVGPLIGCEAINNLFKQSLQDNKYFHYGEFINDLSKLLVGEFSEKISFYIMNNVSNFKSQWTEIRCNAVLFSGYLLGHLSKDKQSVLSKEHISNGK
jgi:maestro heat-like repeat-containing protein family member 1